MENLKLHSSKLLSQVYGLGQKSLWLCLVLFCFQQNHVVDARTLNWKIYLIQYGPNYLPNNSSCEQTPPSRTGFPFLFLLHTHTNFCFKFNKHFTTSYSVWLIIFCYYYLTKSLVKMMIQDPSLEDDEDIYCLDKALCRVLGTGAYWPTYRAAFF